MKLLPDIILVDDDNDLRHALAQGLELDGRTVAAFDRAEPALAILSRDFSGAVVSDIRMPGMDGSALLLRVLEIDPAIPVILITGHGDVRLAVESMQLGAYDFLEKPFTPARLAETAARALEKRRLVLENRALRETMTGSENLADVIVGSSAAMTRLRAEVRAIAATDADVIITGETGSGKEVVARAIHRLSPRSDGPFIALNCGALPAEIIESELFGHERGAFTGAIERRIGKLEHASGGTVLLDEIESMPLDLQVKLLRVLEERAIERVGSNRHIKIDVRFVAASKADLRRESEVGRFRADLFYRLNVVAVSIPPLRDHREDIDAIFFHLAREARGRYRRDVPDILPPLLQALRAHDWPGNIRELRNVADRFVIGMPTGFEAVQPSAPASMAGATLAHQADTFEKGVIEAAFQRHGGRMKPVYEELGISRKTLYDKLKRYGIAGGDG